MKWILFFLLIPFGSSSQTVHVKDEKIYYEGLIKINSSETNPEKALEEAEKNCSTRIHNLSINKNDSENKITVLSEMNLTPTQSNINTLQYTLQLSVKQDHIKYKIDSFFLITKERGGKADTIPSKEIVKDMDVTGPVATATEKKLNQIDMKIQELIDRLRNYFSQ